MIDLLWLVLFPAVVAAGASGLAVQLRPGWSVRRTVLTAALPVPALMASFCVWLIGRTMTASREQCGVDACGMAAAFSVMGLGLTLVAFVVGGAAAYWIKRSTVRP